MHKPLHLLSQGTLQNVHNTWCLLHLEWKVREDGVFRKNRMLPHQATAQGLS